MEDWSFVTSCHYFIEKIKMIRVNDWFWSRDYVWDKNVRRIAEVKILGWSFSELLIDSLEINASAFDDKLDMV